MQITRSSVDTAKGATDCFTGDVYIDAVGAAPPPSIRASTVAHLAGPGQVALADHRLPPVVVVPQAELAETYGGSQPTISRAISAVTPLLDKALRGYVPTADELDARTTACRPRRGADRTPR